LHRHAIRALQRLAIDRIVATPVDAGLLTMLLRRTFTMGRTSPTTADPCAAAASSPARNPALEGGVAHPAAAKNGIAMPDRAP
jgi:hypothetical protein